MEVQITETLGSNEGLIPCGERGQALTNHNDLKVQQGLNEREASLVGLGEGPSNPSYVGKNMAKEMYHVLGTCIKV